MHDTTTLDGESLLQLITQQFNVLQQLQQLGVRQQQLIVEGQVSELLSLLAEKQQVLERLGEVQTALRPARGQSPQTRRWSSPQRKEQCLAISAHCDALLAGILQSEADSEASLTQARDGLAARLQQSSGSLHAARAYHVAQAAAQPSTARLDLSSGS